MNTPVSLPTSPNRVFACLARLSSCRNIGSVLCDIIIAVCTTYYVGFSKFLPAVSGEQLNLIFCSRWQLSWYDSPIKQTKIIMESKRLQQYLRIANPLVHMVAGNVGLSLFADRNRHKIMLLENSTSTPFVTADQPVINIATSPKDTKPPAKFELYCPLSPTKAMLLLEPHSDFCPANSSVPETFVSLYNLRMAAYSYRQVFSISPNVLESIRDELVAYMSCFSSDALDE